MTLIEIKADVLMLKVPLTREGIAAVRAMVNVFEAMLTEDENLFKELLTEEGEEHEDDGIHAVPATSFSPVISSPKQRIKFKDWEAIGTSRAGRIYKEVVNRILEEYKDEIAPKPGVIPNIIREMYGEHLTKNSIISYASVYKRYIKENKLAVEPPVEDPKTNSLHIVEPIIKPIVKPSHIEYSPKGKYLLPIKKVIEIWELLPDEFEYKQVKALVPAYIMQSAARIDTAKFIIKQFLEIAEFGCEEASPGYFKKADLKTKE